MGFLMQERARCAKTWENIPGSRSCAGTGLMFESCRVHAGLWCGEEGRSGDFSGRVAISTMGARSQKLTILTNVHKGGSAPCGEGTVGVGGPASERWGRPTSMVLVDGSRIRSEAELIDVLTV